MSDKKNDTEIFEFKNEMTEIFVVKSEYINLPASEKYKGLDLIQKFVDDQKRELAIEKKADELLEVLNKTIESCEPMTIEEFNIMLYEKEEGLLEKIEKENNKIGIRYIDHDDKEKGFCISTLTIIATITDVLLGKRLAFNIDDDTNIINKVTWYVPPLVKDTNEKK